MDWNKKIRPRGWYQSGKTLLWIWLGGSVLLSVLFLSFLYPLHTHLESLHKETEEAKAYLKQHGDVLHPDYQLPPEPTAEELLELQGQLPTDFQAPRLLLQLQKVVKATGAEWVEMRSAEKWKELKPMEMLPSSDDPDLKEEDEEADQEKQEQEESVEVKEEQPASAKDALQPDIRDSEGDAEKRVKELQSLLPKDQRIQPFWVDLYVQGSYEDVPELLAELDQLERRVIVVDWEYIGEKGEPANIRIRFAAFTYEDPQLKGLPDLPDLEDADDQETTTPSTPKKKKDENERSQDELIQELIRDLDRALEEEEEKVP